MSDASETHFGFKRITTENWQDADVPRLFGLTTPDNWIGAHLQPQLSPNVPQEIAALFEVARGSMIYGWFFYPLITLGAEQCYRVLEAAVRKRCEQAGIPTKRQNKKGKLFEVRFVDNIESLITAGIIQAAARPHWEVIRQLRNIASHPESQMILTPGIAISHLVSTADLLDSPYICLLLPRQRNQHRHLSRRQTINADIPIIPMFQSQRRFWHRTK